MLNASIVLYHHAPAEIEKLVQTLRDFSLISEIYLIDNSREANPAFEKLPATYIYTGKNLGYGAAHNIAIRRSIEQNIPYHLVINPDVLFEGEILGELLDFMESNKEVGHVMPKVLYPNGDNQFLCKLLPTPSDLFLRRFLPPKWTQKSNERFELRQSGYDKIMDIPYLSGCFMLLRTKVLKEIGLFDERFFMYPEDIDLTRRIHQKYRTIFYPNVQIVHNHEQGSYKSTKLFFIHTWNLIKYFNKYGWIFDNERKEINKNTLKKLNLS
ncbi:MAG: glycosyltransferase family 2 protein [Porphyromonadaceae bacterium]|nr:glycosyltransferase family 2 protein [Porphyromonadaceae bacterium]